VKVKKIVFLLLVSVTSIIVFAHEFWLQPQKFFYTLREVANIRFQVGENFTGENWIGNKDKIQQLLYFKPSGGIVDLSARLSENKGDSLQLPLQEEGTHMIIFHSHNSLIHLEPIKFNAYLKEDGLDHAALYRKTHNEENRIGKEYYQRSVKTILQISENLTDACTKPSGLPLDIIPEENPYSIPVLTPRDAIKKVKFQVLFNGQPLNNTLVKIWYHSSKTQVKMDTARTNKKGWVTAERHSGPYMVSCVHMEQNHTDTVADWQSYWASLSFEYSQFFTGNGIR